MEAPEEMRDNSTTVLQTLIAECLIFLYSQQGRGAGGEGQLKKACGAEGCQYSLYAQTVIGIYFIQLFL